MDLVQVEEMDDREAPVTTQRYHAAGTRRDHGRGDAPRFFSRPDLLFGVRRTDVEVRDQCVAISRSQPPTDSHSSFRGSHLVPNENPCGVDGFDVHAARGPRKDGVDSEELAGNVPPESPDLNRNRHPISDVHKTQSCNGPSYRLGRRTAAGRRHGNLTPDGRFFTYFRAVISESYVSQLC